MNGMFSLIMIKPDALKRGLLDEIETRLSQKSLQIVKRTELIMDRPSILRLWPGIFRQSTIERSYSYLGGVPLPVWLIYGSDAVSQTLAVKSEMRRDFCDPEDKLHTLFHCPDTDEDFFREYPILFSNEPLT